VHKHNKLEGLIEKNTTEGRSGSAPGGVPHVLPRRPRAHRGAFGLL